MIGVYLEPIRSVERHHNQPWSARFDAAPSFFFNSVGHYENIMMRGVLSSKIADSYGMRDGFSNAVTVSKFSFHQKGDNPSCFEVMHWMGLW